MTCDAEIVKRVRQGDRQAYGVLVKRYERSIFAATLVILRDHHLADDATQEAFISAYIKLDSLRKPERFLFWVMAIARRIAKRTLKEFNRRHLALPSIAYNYHPQRTEDTCLDDEKSRLLRQLQRLPDNQRIAISLRYLDGHSVKEISGITGHSVGTITKRLSRAIKKLQKRCNREK